MCHTYHLPEISRFWVVGLGYSCVATQNGMTRVSLNQPHRNLPNDLRSSLTMGEGVGSDQISWVLMCDQQFSEKCISYFEWGGRYGTFIKSKLIIYSILLYSQYLIKSHRISPNLAKSHRVSLYFTL